MRAGGARPGNAPQIAVGLAIPWNATRPEQVVDFLNAGGGAKLTAQQFGWTLLHRFVIDAKYEFVQLLLDRGADPNVRGKWGETPLHRAALLGNEELCALLVRYGAQREAQNDAGSTTLDLARHHHPYALEVHELLSADDLPPTSGAQPPSAAADGASARRRPSTEAEELAAGTPSARLPQSREPRCALEPPWNARTLDEAITI